MTLLKTMLASAAAIALLSTGALAQSDTATPAPTAVPEATATPARTVLRQPMMAHDGYTTVTTGEISTDDLTGATAYDADDVDIGEVHSVILAADGTTVDHVVLDIGGFLGIGMHQVALTPTEVQIMRRGTSDDIRVYVDATKAELEAQPEYVM